MPLSHSLRLQTHGRPVPMNTSKTPEPGRDSGRRCTAHSSRTGEPCKKLAIRGGVVCRSHGGGSPQARLKARERLDAMVEPALTDLQWAIRTAKKNQDVQAVLRAVFGILDRTGFPAGLKVDLEADPDQILARILGVEVSELPGNEPIDVTPEQPRALPAAPHLMEGGDLMDDLGQRVGLAGCCAARRRFDEPGS